MKKLLSALIAASLLFSSVVVPVSAAGNTKLLNGGFEDGLNSWTLVRKGTIAITIDNAISTTQRLANGAKSLKLKPELNSGSKGTYLYQEIDVPKNTYYFASMTAYYPNGSGAKHKEELLGLKIYGTSISDENLLGYVINIEPSCTIWYQHNVTFNTGNHEKIYYVLESLQKDDAYCPIWVDNCKLIQKNTVQDLGFEESTVDAIIAPNGAAGPNVVTKPIQFVRTTEEYHSGTASLKYTGVDNNWPQVKTVFMGEPNTEYVLSFWYTHYAKVRAGKTFGGTDIESETIFKTDGSWREYSKTITTGADGLVYLSVEGEAGADKYAYYDDFSLKKVGEEEPEQPGVEILKEIHVSPSGDDANEGTEDSPFKTLQRAKKYIESADLSKVDEDINVIFHEGKYNFNVPVQFSAANSGTKNANIIYRAAEGEDVVFSGAVEIPASKIATVTDENILAKVSESARDNLVSVKLTDCGIAALPAMNTISLYNELYNGKEYVALYNNGKEQPLSQWPNGDDEYVSWVEATNKGGALVSGDKTGGTFVYKEDRPSRWSNVTDIWVGGYPGYNYRYERNSVGSINPETKEITLATWTCFGIVSKESKAWKAFNVLEEIDMPGEWYIDRNQMMLYYYSPSRHNNSLELSVLEDAFIKLSDTEYVKFSGIKFEKSREKAIEMKDVGHVDITGCTFTDIGTDAIYMYGETRAKTDSSMYKDAAYDCQISGNIFYNLGGSAARIDGGNIDTLTKGNVVFTNNYVYGAAEKIKNREMIYVYGCGNTVSNNNISSASFQAIRYYGNDHIITQNEIYNVNKASDDAGAVYAGRNYVQRGTEISYNFIHDSNPVRNLSRGFTTGIYWDDSQAGQYAHHNIIKGVHIGAYSCGQDNRLEYNTFVDCVNPSATYTNYAIMFTDSYQNQDERKTREQEQYNAIADKDLYNAKYEKLDDGLSESVLSNYLTKNVFNKAINNLTVNSGENWFYWNTSSNITAKLQNEASGNSKVDSCSDFNDPANLDYRVKVGSATANSVSGLLTTAYNIDLIGNQTNLFSKTSPLATFNKSGVAMDGNNAIFTWDDALGANQYRVLIATDEAMTQKVIDTVVDYNLYTTTTLDTSKQYYWTVYAINTSREYKGEWQCKEGATPVVFIAVKDLESVTNFGSENLIVNGGFENGLEGWVTDDNGVFKAVRDNFVGLKDVTQTVINGRGAARASASNGVTAGYMYQEVPVTANTNYVLNLSWYNLLAGNRANGSVRIYGDSMTQENLLATVGNLFYGEKWYSSTCAFNSGEHEKIYVRFDFSHTTAGMYYCVDNITLKAAGNTQTIGFESGIPEDFNIRNSNYAVSTEKAYEGTHSIKLTSDSVNYLANATFALNPNSYYALTFWYYIENGKLGYVAKHAHQNGWNDYLTGALKTETLSDTGEWKKAVVRVNDSGVLSSGSNKFVELAFQNMESNTVVYIDNIQCIPYVESIDSITVFSDNRDGGWLNAKAEAYNYGEGFYDPITYQWQISSDKKNWTDVAGANTGDYMLTSADSQRYLRVKVTTSNRWYTAVSEPYYSKAIAIGDIIADSVWTLTNSSGAPVTQLTEIADGELNVGFALKYFEPQSINVFTAIYDNTGTLRDIQLITRNAVAEETDDFEFTLTLPTDEDLTGYTLRTFVWDNILRPLLIVN